MMICMTPLLYFKSISNVASTKIQTSRFTKRASPTGSWQALSALHSPAVTDRAGVRRVCRRQEARVAELLNGFPKYFEAVAEEMRASR